MRLGMGATGPRVRVCVVGMGTRRGNRMAVATAPRRVAGIALHSTTRVGAAGMDAWGMAGACCDAARRSLCFGGTFVSGTPLHHVCIARASAYASG